MFSICSNDILNKQQISRLRNSDLGADSLDVLEIVMGIEDEFGIQVPTDEAQSIITVGDAYDKIKKALEK